MESIPLGLLILLLLLCLAFSAFFSASETAMMSLNRYKLKHQADEGNKRAKCASHLLKHTDRLIGTILLGNNFVNIAATSLGTLIGLRLYGDLGVLLSTIILTAAILVFSEVAPKTLAATNAQRIALPVAPVLAWLVRIFSPLVRFLNAIVRIILRPLGVKTENAVEEALSNDELRSIVQSSQSGDDEESSEQQDMLLNVLELEDVSVSEAMVPRNELEGVDLNDDCGKSPAAATAASSPTVTTSTRRKECCTSATSSCRCATTASTKPGCNKYCAPATSSRKARRCANCCCNSARRKRAAASSSMNTATFRG